MITVPRRDAAAVVCTTTCLSLLLAAAPASADVIHERESWHHRTFVGHDLNICGDLGTFTWDTSGHSISTDTGSGFHVTNQENATYTLEFDDPALGTWEARGTEVITFNATPGEAVNFHVNFNSFEGPIKIRERMTFVVDANGEVRVDMAVSDVGEC